MKSQCFHLKNSMHKMTQLFSPLPKFSHINVRANDSYIHVQMIFSLLQQTLIHDV